jgi:hypothetical protein
MILFVVMTTRSSSIEPEKMNEEIKMQFDGNTAFGTDGRSAPSLENRAWVLYIH